MKTLKELRDEREEIKLKLIELDKEICQHPEHIREQFHHNPFWKLDRFEALIGRVNFVKRLTPNGVWHPFVYRMDDVVVEVSFSESELDQNEEYNVKMADQLWNSDDPVQWLEEHGVDSEVKQVGYLLYLTMKEHWDENGSGDRPGSGQEA